MGRHDRRTDRGTGRRHEAGVFGAVLGRRATFAERGQRWHGPRLERRKRCTDRNAPARRRRSAVCGVFTDGRRVVANSGRRLYLWNEGRAVRLDANPVRENIVSVAFAPEGARFISAGDGGTLQIWDATRGNRIAAFSPPEGGNLSFDLDTRTAYSAGFSPDGRFAISSGADGVIRIWNPANGTQIGSIKGNAGAVRSAVFALDGRHVVAGGDDRTVRTWLAVISGSTSFLSDPIAVLGGHTDRVNAVTALPGGSRIASASDDKTVRVWGPLPGTVFRTADGLEVRGVAISPDGRLSLPRPAVREAAPRRRDRRLECGNRRATCELPRTRDRV